MSNKLYRGIFVALSVMVAMLMTASVAIADHSDRLAGAVILIVRHAEKPNDGPGLAPAGERRAAAYVRYFENYRVDGQVRRPDSLFASADSRGSQRPRLTITPLGQKLGLTIDHRFRDKDVDGLVDAVRSSPGGKTILICWHHGEIPDLLQAFGVDPGSVLPNGEWPGDRYDWVIEIRFDENGRPHHVTRINEHLMPGDSPQPGT